MAAPAQSASSNLTQRTCRKCKRSGGQCRLHNGIQWCLVHDPPFNEWRENIYPGCKQSARFAAAKRRARATGVKGRPKSDATSRSTFCRKCKQRGSKCRLHNHIQWCSVLDPAFDEWVCTTYPALKADAKEKAIQRLVRSTGTRGRPSKKVRARMFAFVVILWLYVILLYVF